MTDDGRLRDRAQVRVRFAKPDDVRTIPCLPTPTPGLVVGQNGSSFPVVHVRSGLIIGRYDDPEAALGCATELGKLRDWTRPVTNIGEMTMDERLALLEVCVRWGGRMGVKPAHLEDL